MEPTFSVLRVPQRQDYLEFAAYLRRRHSKLRRLLSAGYFCLMIAFTVIAAIWEQPLFSCVLLLFAVLWTFTDRMEGLQLCRRKKRQIGPTELRFYDDRLQCVSRLSDETLCYTGMEDFLETDRLFLLAISKLSYILVPKAAFPADRLDAFRAFIGERCGLPCRKSPLHRAWRWVCIAVCCAALAAALVITFLMPKTFAFDSYSITLPREFEEYSMTSDSNVFPALLSGETAVLLAPYGENTPEYIYRYIDGTVSTSPALFYNAEESDSVPLDNGLRYFTKIYSERSVLNAYAVATGADGSEFETVFVCSTRLREKYEPLFLKWAATIRVDPQD